MTAMREEVDNLALRLYYLNNAKIEVKSDITIMQRAAEKASSELSKAEQEKLQQDMLAHRMQRTVDKLTEDCELLKEQLAAAEDEVRAGESILKDMENQVFGIRMDRKRLMAHWTTSLIGLQRRNEAYSELMRDFNKKQEELTKVSSEIEGIKRDITLEQEAHERLTIQLHRTQGEIDALNKEHERLKTRHDELQKDYTQAQRIMDETDKNLDSANATQKSLDNEMDLLQKRLEKELTKKHELENQMDLLLREKLSANKATIYVKKMAANVHEQSRDLEAQAVILENTLANDSLAVAQIQAETRAMQEQAQELDKEIQKRTETLTKLQLNIKRANATVLRKQNSIDMLGQKLQRLLKESGGVELGPLEIMRNHLVKGIAAKQEEIGNLEQQWLKEQTDLMNKVKEKEKLGEDIARQQCCLSVLAKKKLRLDSEINTIERERTNLERDVVHLQNSMARLNKSIYTKRSSGTALEQENRLAEEDFVRSIREKEMQAVEAEGRLKEAIQEKEDLLAELIETERHIMLWEKKVQLVNETRHAVDSAVGKNELRAIRIEIQRMETRKAQIARQQEQLIQALEQSVQKRDTIITRNENAKVVKARQESSKTALLREIEDLRSKIGATEKAIVEYDEESEKLEAETKRLEKDLEDKYFACEAVRKRSAELNKQLQKLAETRQKNLIELQMRQHASRYWEQLLAGRYRRLCPTRQGAQSERERQIGRTRAMLAVVDRLTTEFPAIKQDLSAAWQILTDKLEQEERTEMHESDTSAT
uniref:TEX12 protein n=1 Tax=Mesocestoides corti TaxID=53468 RepID=A0A5K3F2D7_MESCO